MHSERIQGSIKNISERYLLISDDCDQCRYIANAFSLLQLPLLRYTITDLIESGFDLPHTSAMLLCETMEQRHGARIAEDQRLQHIQRISISTCDKRFKSNSRHFARLKMPFSANELSTLLSQCTSKTNDDFLNLSIAAHPAFDKLIGHSEPIRRIRAMIQQVAETDSTVLISGQSGTGKDVIASCIHHLSHRTSHTFVPINCGAIPSELIESELFGHEKGAFTGALTKRPGRFEIASGGTLFLDEIGDMPLPMQVKLLRVIQERRIDRVGGNMSIPVDVRLIAATNKNLDTLIQQNLFREDLFYRLNVFPIQVPCLNERSDDIPLLMEFHLDRIYQRLNHRIIFTEEAKALLCQYEWPGNIRELENFLERMVILHRDQVIDVDKIDVMYQRKSAGKLHTRASACF